MLIESLSQDSIGIMKFYEGNELDVRMLVKEACIYKHLQKLQGFRIPKLLSYGVPGTLRSNIILGVHPRFFFVVEYYGEILGPTQISASELADLLNNIHGHGILLGCRGFPQVTRHESKLVLVDMAEAVFDKDKEKAKKEFDYLTKLCRGGKEP